MLSDWILMALIGILALLVAFLYVAVRFFGKARKRSYPRSPKFQVLHINDKRGGQTFAQSLFNPPLYSLSVVIPAYNEEGRIGEMLRDTIAYLEGRSVKGASVDGKRTTFLAEVIVVDDGSTDGTVKRVTSIVKRLTPSHVDVKLISFPRNQGKGAAVSEGILTSLGKLILFADADGATRIEEVEKLEPYMATFDIACGSRFTNDKTIVKRNPLRKKLMEAFHYFVGFFGVSHIKDTQCGFKLFTRDAAKRVLPNLRLNGWIFDVEMLILAQLLGLRVAEVSVNWMEKGGSKLRIAVDSSKMALDLLLMRFAYHSGLWKIYKGASSTISKR